MTYTTSPVAMFQRSFHRTARHLPAVEPGAIRITGTLLDHAEVRATSGAEPHALCLLNITTGAGLPVRAQHDMGAGFAMHLAAHSKAQLLRAGDAVTITCDGLLAAPGTGALTCLRVRDVIPHRTAREVAA